MSSEKGGALVRSPPALVEAYAAHVGPNAKWDTAAPVPPHISPPKHPQPQRNATVTKIHSGGYKETSTAKNKHNSESKSKPPGTLERDILPECSCGGWARARQIEHDLAQLQSTHESILKGLHQQLEELKQKNRDLTFQLLMGPYANSVRVNVPLSPESDTTPPKEGQRKESFSAVVENGSSAQSKKDQTPGEIGFPQKIDKVHPPTGQETPETTHKRHRKGRSGDPRQVKSLDLEMLEEESKELRKQLEEERSKNKYLLNLAEDLKRQIREETGAWYPPPPNSIKRMGSQLGPYKQAVDARKPQTAEYGTNPLALRLPQIPYQEQKIRDQGQMSQKREVTSQGHPIRPEALTEVQNYRSNEPVSSTTLPAIGRSHESHQNGGLEGKNKTEFQYKSLESSPSMNKHSKGRSKHRQSHNDHGSLTSGTPEVNSLGSEVEPQKEHRHSPGRTHSKNKDHPEHKQHRPKDKNPSQEDKRQKHLKESQKQDVQQSSSSTGVHSPRRGHQSDRTVRRTRTISRSRTSDESGMTPDLNDSRKLKASPSRKASYSHQNDQHDATKFSGKEGSRHLKKASSKSSNSLQNDTDGYFYEGSKIRETSDGLMASSSSSIGSAVSGNNTKSKHRWRNNKRGGKKNKKDVQEQNEETH